MPLGVSFSPLGIAAPIPLSSSVNCALVFVPASANFSGLPITVQVALSAISPSAASALPAEKFSKKLRTIFLFVSALIEHLPSAPLVTQHALKDYLPALQS